MEVEDRKRAGVGEVNGNRPKPPDDDGGGQEKVEPPQSPADEEMEEFFAILKRSQVAVNYFRRRDGVSFLDGDLTAKPPWRPTFRLEDFEGAKNDLVKNPGAGLDLNSDPIDM